MKKPFEIALDAYWRFIEDDGWAIASHVALSILLAMFPFLIVVTALAGFFGSRELADEAAAILLETWPERVAGPIAAEIRNVLTQTRGGLFTIGLALSVWFASSGVEALRIALNRAYGLKETRRWWLLRLESIAYVVLAAIALVSVAFLIILYPLIWNIAVRHVPQLRAVHPAVDLARLAIATISLSSALVVAHLWLPIERRLVGDVLPGIVVTLTLSLGSATAFGAYLGKFSGNYVTTYAGLASVIIALVFLYTLAAIFIYGGELNAAIMRRRAETKTRIV